MVFPSLLLQDSPQLPSDLNLHPFCLLLEKQTASKEENKTKQKQTGI